MFEELFYKRLAELRIKKGVSARDMSLSIGQATGYINSLEKKMGSHPCRYSSTFVNILG